MIHPGGDGEYYELTDPVSLPKASGFLWNDKMLIQATCRGYASARFMQPEPTRYSYGPNMEAKTFMLPEPSYYTHHPGRFVYVKDEEDKALFFSAPYEPVRQKPKRFSFQVWKHKLVWLKKKISNLFSAPQKTSVKLFRLPAVTEIILTR